MKQVAKIQPQSNEVMQYDPNIINVLRNSLYPGASEPSVLMVIDYCRHAKLDVMLKPVHIVPMWIVDKESGQGSMRDVIMHGINFYRIQASRSGCAGISEPEYGEDITECLGGVDITYPKWCKMTVKRNVAGNIVEFTAIEYWKENYATAGKDKQTGKMSTAPNAMWKKRPYAQLAKCTEAQALRKAFPQIGAMPTAEEMEGKQLDSDELEALQPPVPKKGVSGLKEKLGMKKPVVPKEEAEPVEFDGETGEVIDAEAEVVAPSEYQHGGMTADTMTFLIESADSLKELNETMKHLKDLNADEKKSVYAIYKKKEAELKG